MNKKRCHVLLLVIAFVPLLAAFCLFGEASRWLRVFNPLLALAALFAGLALLARRMKPDVLSLVLQCLPFGGYVLISLFFATSDSPEASVPRLLYPAYDMLAKEGTFGANLPLVLYVVVAALWVFDVGRKRNAQTWGGAGAAGGTGVPVQPDDAKGGELSVTGGAGGTGGSGDPAQPVGQTKGEAHAGPGT